MRANPNYFIARTKEIPGIRTYQADTDINPIPLDLRGYYTELLIKLTLDVETGSSPSTAPLWYANLLNSIKIEPSNSAPFISLDDGRYLYYEDYLRSEGSLDIPELPGANLRQTITWQLPVHFGDEYRNEHDVSDVIPTRGLNDLRFRMRWGSASDLGTGYTIHSGSVELEVSYVTLQPGVRESQAFPGIPFPGKTRLPCLWRPHWHTQQIRDIQIAYSGFGLKESLPQKLYLREVLILVLDDTDSLVDTILTELQIRDRGGSDFLTKSWIGLERENMRDFRLPSRLIGVGWVDLKRLFQTGPAGHYLSKQGDFDWNLTIQNVSLANRARVVFVYRTHKAIKSRHDIIGKSPPEFQ